MHAAHGRVGDVEPVHRARHAHIAEAPLLFERRRVVLRCEVREQPLFDADQEHGRVLEPFCDVHGHQADAVVAFLDVIDLGVQGDLLEEQVHQGLRSFFVLDVVALELFGCGEQFLQVLEARLGLDRGVLLERAQVARTLQDRGQ